MANEITNAVLLEHIHAMKSDLLGQIAKLDAKIDAKTGGLDMKITNLTLEMHQGFKEAREHRQMLQEDLDASMRMLRRHDIKLSRLKRGTHKTS